MIIIVDQHLVFAIIVLMLALLQYLFFVIKTGLARKKADITPPACAGDTVFERLFRIQQNTLEQLIVFIPALLGFACLVNPLWGAGLGLGFIIGRFLYYRACLDNPDKRAPGMLLTLLSNGILALGALIGAIISLWKL